MLVASRCAHLGAAAEAFDDMAPDFERQVQGDDPGDEVAKGRQPVGGRVER